MRQPPSPKKPHKNATAACPAGATRARLRHGSRARRAIVALSMTGYAADAGRPRDSGATRETRPDNHGRILAWEGRQVVSTDAFSSSESELTHPILSNLH